MVLENRYTLRQLWRTSFLILEYDWSLSEFYQHSFSKVDSPLEFFIRSFHPSTGRLKISSHSRSLCPDIWCIYRCRLCRLDIQSIYHKLQSQCYRRRTCKLQILASMVHLHDIQREHKQVAYKTQQVLSIDILNYIRIFFRSYHQP